MIPITNTLYYVGLDLGGTTMMAGVVVGTGREADGSRIIKSRDGVEKP
jgi:predicted NBD/HSP70 family sugar kinase